MNVWEFCLSTHRSNGNVAGCFDHTFFFVAFSVFGGSLWGPVGIMYNISNLIYIYIYIFLSVLPCYGPKASKSWIWMGYGLILAMVQRGVVFCCCFLFV